MIGAGNLWRQIEAHDGDARMHRGYHEPPNHSRFGYPREAPAAFRRITPARIGQNVVRLRDETFLGR